MYILADFDDAMLFANRSRRAMPALYNSVRENEQPIPPTNASGGDEDLLAETFVEYTDQNSGIDDGEIQDVKPDVLPVVHLDAADVDAFDAMCNTDSDSDEEEIDVSNQTNSETDPLANNDCDQSNEDDGNGAVGGAVSTSISFNDDAQAAQINVTSVESETDTNNGFIENGQTQEVQNASGSGSKTVEMNESLEMIYSSLQDFRPYFENEYVIKANDPVCHNRPFKPNVRVCFYFQPKMNEISNHIFSISFSNSRMVIDHSKLILVTSSKSWCCRLAALQSLPSTTVQKNGTIKKPIRNF